LVPAKAFACPCRLHPLLPELPLNKQQIMRNRLKSAGAIFIGEVIDISKKDNRYRGIYLSSYYEIKFKLQRTWKNTKKNELIVRTTLRCLMFVERGKRYLIFASFGNNRDELWTNACSGNKPLEEATESLKLLGKGRSVK
jgi:hypothetical protein